MNYTTHHMKFIKVLGIIAAVLILLIAAGIGLYRYNNQPVSIENTTVPSTGKITLAQLQANKNNISCWSSVQGKVYDLTKYVSKHPGGAELFNGCGKEIDSLFPKHPGGRFDSDSNLKKIQEYYIGELVK
jgi:cytochrome b involved in lipid metabolism